MVWAELKWSKFIQKHHVFYLKSCEVVTPGIPVLSLFSRMGCFFDSKGHSAGTKFVHFVALFDCIIWTTAWYRTDFHKLGLPFSKNLREKTLLQVHVALISFTFLFSVSQLR